MLTESIDISQMMHDYAEDILDQFQDGIYITDGEANTLYLNDSYERISGLKRLEMIGRNMQELMQNRVISVSGTLAVLSSKESVTIEQSFRTGKRAIITSMPIFDKDSADNRIVMVVTVVREITEIYQIKKALIQQEKQTQSYERRLELMHLERLHPDGTEELPDEVCLKDEVAKLESLYIDHAFQKYGNVRAAAKSLDIDSSTFVRKRQRYIEMGLLEPMEPRQESYK